MFLVGTQYYRPPTPSIEEWERDLKNIHKSGMNIIRGWITWGWLNPAPDEYEFDEIQYLLDSAHKYKIKVVMLISLEAAPYWVIHEHQEAVYVASNGFRRIPSVGNNSPCGGFPGLCFDHKQVRALAVKFIRELVKRFKDHPAIHCWEPQNEPMMEGARYYDETFCYCDESIKQFRKWLKNKYKTMDNLIQSWKHKYSDWEQVNPPRETGGTWADWIDWRNFTMDNVAEHLKWRKKAVSDIDKKHTIMIHARAGATILQDTLTQCIDDWRFSKLFEVFGQAAFPQRWDDVDYRLGLEATRCVAGKKEWWQGELQSGHVGMGTTRGEYIPAKELDYWSWMSIAYGAKALLYWQYRPERCGFEYGFGLTKLNGDLSERTEVVKNVSKILQKHDMLFENALAPDSSIAIVYTPNVTIMHSLGEKSPDPPLDAIKGLYRVLSEHDYQVDIIRGDEYAVDDDYSKYKVIYLPCPTWISKHSSQKLKIFVKDGGILVSEPSLAMYDDEFFSSQKVPGLGLDKVFGIERDVIEGLKNPVSINWKNKKLPASYYKEHLIVNTAKVIGKFDDGKPAITVNSFGKGKAIYLASNAFREYHFSKNSVFAEFIKSINTNLKREAYTGNNKSFTRILNSGKAKIVFVFNCLAKPTTSIIKIPYEKRKPIELISGKSIQSKTVNGIFQISTNLESHDTRIYLFK